MKRIFIIISIITGVLSLKAQNNNEAYNIISDSYNNFVQDTVLVRKINGGTIITPIFDSSCPEEMKGPFSFACKIVEEYMPPCIPIKVGVSCGRVNSAQNAISKVTFKSREYFGRHADYYNAPLSMIKGVILAELSFGSTKSFLDSVPNVQFLTKDNDIEITYNERKLNELSFSLDNDPGENYDFVSLAIRDLLIGLGISHKYTYNYVTKELQNPAQEFTPFEYYINEMLGNEGNGAARLQAATKGELLLGKSYGEQLKLYAPATWQNGVSLNYFIPQDDSDVSQILSHDFCKGMVTRALNDDYASFIFRELLGWKPDYVSGNVSTNSVGGSTSLKMPYNGSISLGDNITYGMTSYMDEAAVPTSSKLIKRTRGVDEEYKLLQYVDSFKPFYTAGQYDNVSCGVSFSILKKDGTWDMVKYLGDYYRGMQFELNMSECEFHYDAEEYARTIDGYLRGRVTTKYQIGQKSYEYKSKFFVIDYLPQKVKIACKLMENAQTASLDAADPLAITYYPVRIYFSDIEGVDRIVLERLRTGFRVPSKIEVSDFKKGYYDLTIDRETTFTAVAYNANGSSRSIPVTIAPISAATAADLQFSISDGMISFDTTGNESRTYSYSIMPLDTINARTAVTGESYGDINISNLADGLYILTVTHPSGISSTFKFKK